MALTKKKIKTSINGYFQLIRLKKQNQLSGFKLFILISFFEDRLKNSEAK